ncbi:hypothetical protein GM708_12865 [Vibrio cholerae]|nr:hypothetical protein [Vibrio cholerae]
MAAGDERNDDRGSGDDRPRPGHDPRRGRPGGRCEGRGRRPGDRGPAPGRRYRGRAGAAAGVVVRPAARVPDRYGIHPAPAGRSRAGRPARRTRGAGLDGPTRGGVPDRRLPCGSEPAVPGVAENGNRPPVITAADVARLATDGVQPAVVFTAPSGVRAFRERLGDGPHAFVPVAIGRTTAEALRTLGWAPAATAADPTPRAIASAVQEAFSRGGSAGRAPVPPNGDQS